MEKSPQPLHPEEAPPREEQSITGQEEQLAQPPTQEGTDAARAEPAAVGVTWDIVAESARARAPAPQDEGESPSTDVTDDTVKVPAPGSDAPHPETQSGSARTGEAAAATGSTTAGAGDDAESAATPAGEASSCNNGLDKATEQESPQTSDRIFPIRSVVSLHPPGKSPSSEPDYFGGYSRAGQSSNQRASFAESTPLSPTISSPGSHFVCPSRKSTLAGAISSVTADAERRGSTEPPSLFENIASDRSEASGSLGVAPGMAPNVQTPSDMGPDSYFTTHFTHTMMEGNHAVITGHDGTLQHCEDEPIHTPGAVQGFGLLIALRETSDGSFLVRYVSENSKRIIGYSPQELFRLKSFTDILSEERADNFLDHIDFIRDEDSDPASNGPEVFGLTVRPPNKNSIKLWSAVHINPAHPDLVLWSPEDTLHSNPTLEELVESTEILSKPLRVLRNARRRRGDAGAMQVFDIMSQIQEQLASAPNLQVFLKILVGIIKEMTGFHRVMIYQFDSSFNGKVVTELVDTTQTLDLYKGLNFPASDIPRQARELYKLNRVRLLYDRELESARIVCRVKEDLDMPLDMSHCYLRAMSPIHLKYLGNMCVRSSMSLSLNAFNELWGLIACHSYGPKGMRVSFPIRKMCRLITDTASRNIERLSYASRLQARKLINTSPTEKNPSGYIVASSDDLLKLFDADFGVLSIQGETKMLGSIEQTQEALAMLEYLRLRKLTSVLASQDVKVDFPDLKYPPGFAIIAGLLYVPLSVGGNDFIVFFRKGVIKEVRWAGNPYEKLVKEGTAGYLEPRKSFQIWREQVIGKSREWTEEQVETSAVLCLVYGKFIEVWRQKEAALQNSRLTRLLLANSAHEVRTPLNAIINYLEIALEGTLDQETRENLARSHSASKSLIYVINDLLDLTKTEEGKSLIKDESFDLPRCLKEATEPFVIDAERRSITYKVTQHPGLPQYVYGDHRRVRQAISNLASNAFQHTQKGFVNIEAYVTGLEGKAAKIEICVEDTGRGMSSTQLDALFRELEQVGTFEDGQSDDEKESKEGEAIGVRTLGLGLAFVARIVRTMDGQVRLKSELGKGSRFIVQLPFELPEEVEPPGSVTSAVSNPRTIVSVCAAVEKVDKEGELTIVARTQPTDGSASVHSAGSSNATGEQTGNSPNSDADRLIAAISTPLSLGSPEDDHCLRHQPSHDSRMLQSLRLGSPVPGTEYVMDARTPLRPVKLQDEYFDQPISSPVEMQPEQRHTFEVPNASMNLHMGSLRMSPPTSVATSATATAGSDAKHLRVLVAEDDPINMKILKKRLEKAGHQVHHAVNGQDCAVVYEERRYLFDVVLMDMQMPIVDGLSSAKMIRAFEKSSLSTPPSQLAAMHGRIPIIAVSASLVERQKDTYINAGFDGWILKPIDFKRLSILLTGLSDNSIRNSCIYTSGQWEKGGWFSSRTQSDEKNDPTSHLAVPTAA
ncbi:hsp90-like protein [Zalerion maritima]|uniref:Hsp90-like protein n=1 Tax=Zalerion maritima TaxID=339359 RepID=A0AAD5RTM3_9PEZI|nr:hsp90-like protein [Zalerion maritima]